MRSSEVKTRWKAEVNLAWDRHYLGPYRDAAEKTDIAQTVLFDMRKYGRIPSEETVDKWADALGEPRERWRQLAGLWPTPEHLIVREDRAPYDADLLSRLQKEYNIPEDDMAVIREVIEKNKKGEEK